MIATQEILQEFRNCNTSGEQIELFETLATSAEPPIEAFYEILQKIKLEILVVLVIQAFTKVSVEQRDNLKENEDLLLSLSKQAQSGQTDLVRWSAATAIKEIGYDFIAIYQCMSEDIDTIIEKIIREKLKRWDDFGLVQSDDYQDYVRFWAYGPFNKLIEITAKYSIPETISNWLSLKDNITNKQEVHAIETFNQIKVSIDAIKLLSLHSKEKLGGVALKTIENELVQFIIITNFAEVRIDNNLLYEWNQAINYNIDYKSVVNTYPLYKSIFTDYLQSNSPYIRFLAASALYDHDGKLKLGESFFRFLQENSSYANDPAYLFYQNRGYIVEHEKLSYSELLKVSCIYNLLSCNLCTKEPKEDFTQLFNIVEKKVKEREDKLKVARWNLNNKLDKTKVTFEEIKWLSRLQGYYMNFQNNFNNFEKRLCASFIKAESIQKNIFNLKQIACHFDFIEAKVKLEHKITNLITVEKENIKLLKQDVDSLHRKLRRQ